VCIIIDETDLRAYYQRFFECPDGARRRPPPGASKGVGELTREQM